MSGGNRCYAKATSYPEPVKVSQLFEILTMVLRENSKNDPA